MGTQKILFEGGPTLSAKTTSQLQADNNKLLDEGNAEFSDLQDVNIPATLSAAENDKILTARYVQPATYGDGSDGNVTLGSSGSINTYTYLTQTVSRGGDTLYVNSVSGFSVGKQILVHQTQADDVDLVGLWDVGTILYIGANYLQLTAGVGRQYTAGTGNYKAQVVTIPQYNNLDIGNYTVYPPDWDGNKGGLVVFKVAGTLSGGSSGLFSCRTQGFRRGHTVGRGAEGWSGWRTSSGMASNGAFCDSDSSERGGGGGGSTAGTTYGTDTYAGQAYPLSAADAKGRVLFGGGGDGHSGGACYFGAGGILGWVAAKGSWSAQFNARALFGINVYPGASGTVIVYSPDDFSGSIYVASVTDRNGVVGGAGFSVNEAAPDPVVAEYYLNTQNSQVRVTKGINLKTVAQTTIYTVPAAYRLLIDSVEVIVDTITGTGSQPTVKFGTANTSQTSILGATALNDSVMNAVNGRESWDASGLSANVVAASDAIQFGVASASTYTTQTATVVIRGVLI